LFSSREVRSITVTRYFDARDIVRVMLLELTRRELEQPTGAIDWDEGNNWGIEATIEFSQGPNWRLFTDGSHTCLVDEAGQPWFFRISPAEFWCGFLWPPGSTNQFATATPSCKARGLGIYLRDPPPSPR
jgi:hypothetical protein